MIKKKNAHGKLYFYQSKGKIIKFLGALTDEECIAVQTQEFDDEDQKMHIEKVMWEVQNATRADISE